MNYREYEEIRLPSEAVSWAAAAEDPWLVEAVERCLARETGFHDVAAVSLVMRLRRRTLEEEELRAGRALAKGEGLPSEERREREWAREIEPAAARKVENRALVVADRLRTTLDNLGRAPAGDDPEWQRSMLRLLRERDELEGVALLLAEAESCERLDPALRRLDEVGWVAICSLPVVALPECEEHLARAARVEPDGWWVQPSKNGVSVLVIESE